MRRGTPTAKAATNALYRERVSLGQSPSLLSKPPTSSIWAKHYEMVVGTPFQPRSDQLCKVIALNKKTTTCRSADDILSIYQSQERDLNYVNLATAINRFARSSDGGRADAPRSRSFLDQATLSIRRRDEHWGHS